MFSDEFHFWSKTGFTGLSESGKDYFEKKKEKDKERLEKERTTREDERRRLAFMGKVNEQSGLNTFFDKINILSPVTDEEKRKRNEEIDKGKEQVEIAKKNAERGFVGAENLSPLEVSLGKVPADVITQLGVGYGRVGSLGISDVLLPKMGLHAPEPQTQLGQVSQAVGSFGGLLKNPLKIGKFISQTANVGIAKAIASDIRLAKNLGILNTRNKVKMAVKGGQIAKRAGQYASGSMLTLGTAEASADILHPQEYVERFKGGAKIGAIFGAMGMANIWKYPALSEVIRQTGGRALLKIAGHYPEGFASKENLANFVYSEALNTYFLHRGISPEMILTGKIPKSQRAFYEQTIKEQVAYNREVKAEQKETLENEKPQFRGTKDMDYGKKSGRVKVEDIYIEPDNIVEEQVIGNMDAVRRIGEKKSPKIAVDWNPDRQQYEARENAQMIEAIRRVNGELVKGGKEPKTEVEVTFNSLEPSAKKPIPSAVLAMAMHNVHEFTWKMLSRIADTKYYVYNVETRGMRPIHSETANFVKGKDFLKPNEIQFEAKGGDIFPVRAGKEATSAIKKAPDFAIKRGQMLLARASKIEMQLDKKSVAPAKRERLASELKTIDKEIEDIKIEKDSRVHTFEQIARQKDRISDEDTNRKELVEDQKDLRRTVSVLKREQGLRKKLVKSKDKKSQENIRYLQGDMALLKKVVDLSKVDFALEKSRAYLKRGNARLRKLQAVEKTKLSEAEILTNARNIIRKVERAPLEKLPTELREAVYERFKKLDMDVSYDIFLESLTGGKGEPKFSDLYMLEHSFFKLENVDKADRIPIMIENIANQFGLYSPSLSKEFSKIQTKEDLYWAKRRVRYFNRAREKTRKQKGRYPTTLSYMLRPTPMRSLEDMRKWAGRVELNTGLPFHRVVRDMLTGSHGRTIELKEISMLLDRFNDFSPEYQELVRNHYRSMYSGKDVFPDEYPQVATEYIGTVDKIMARLAPEVTKYRHSMWMIAADEKAQTKIYKNPDAFKILEDGRKKYIEAEVSGNWDIYNEWIKGDGASVSTVRPGAYLPEFMLRSRDKGLSKEEMMPHINVMGTTHIQSRANFLKKTIAEIGLEESDIMNPNLNKQLYGYINQVLNLKYLAQPLRAFDKLTGLFNRDLEGAQPIAFGKGSPESKGFSTADLLKTFAHRTKGYPMKGGSLSQALKKTQSTFFRALTVRPYLWLRNLFQPSVTMPHKEIIFDPRFSSLRKEFKWDALPEEIRRRFTEEGVDQRVSFDHSYLALEATEKLTRVPVVGWIFRAAEKVGGIYSLTDSINRRRVFRRSFFRSKYYIQEMKKGNITEEQASKRLGLHKIDPTERKIIRHEIEEGRIDNAGFEISRWFSDNSQWKYSRQEKGLWEQTAEGETWSNLLTWTKGITQSMVTASERIVEGVGTRNQTMVRGGAGTVLGFLLAGTVANEVLQTISVSPGAKHKSYGIDSFMWSLGGITVEMVRDTTDVIAEVITSYDGTKKEQGTALNNFMRVLDNVALRQMMPFAKQALSIAEAMTGRSYISPFKDAISKVTSGYGKDAKYVHRTILESVAHAVLCRDPNKGAMTRKATYMKLQELKRDLVDTKSPFLRVFIKGMIERYEYHSDIFFRYEPYQFYETERRKSEERRILEGAKSMDVDEIKYKQETTYRKMEDWF